MIGILKLSGDKLDIFHEYLEYFVRKILTCAFWQQERKLKNLNGWFEYENKILHK